MRILGRMINRSIDARRAHTSPEACEGRYGAAGRKWVKLGFWRCTTNERKLRRQRRQCCRCGAAFDLPLIAWADSEIMVTASLGARLESFEAHTLASMMHNQSGPGR